MQAGKFVFEIAPPGARQQEDEMKARPVALAAAMLLGSVGSIEAPQPTVGHIALCNDEATEADRGSASPGLRPGPEIAGESSDQNGPRETPGSRGGSTR